jgi:hypothetical protein
MSKQSTPPAIHFCTISAKFALATDHVVRQTSNKLTKVPITPSSHCHHLGTMQNQFHHFFAEPMTMLHTTTAPIHKKGTHRQADTVSSGRFSQARDKNAGGSSTSEYLYFES